MDHASYEARNYNVSPSASLGKIDTTCIPVTLRLTHLFARHSHNGTANPPISLVHISKGVPLPSIMEDGIPQ